MKKPSFFVEIDEKLALALALAHRVTVALALALALSLAFFVETHEKLFICWRNR